MQRRYFALLLVAACAPQATCGETVFSFGGNRNGLTDATSAAVTEDGVTLSITPVIPGSTLNELGQSGLGVNSLGVPDVADLGTTASRLDFNLLQGSGPFDGAGEAISFAFNRSGVLTELDFDGVKDESFEFFRLESSGIDVTFFDSMADPLVATAPGDLVFLQEEVGNPLVDDRSPPLSIPFAAGQTFTLTFGELPEGTVANGARLQGVTVAAVPEPAAGVALLLASACVLLGRGVHNQQQG